MAAGPKGFQKACEAWPILVQAAREGHEITYDDLKKPLGYKGARPTLYALSPIQDLCIEKGWPPLTSIVVNKSSGRPGAGFIDWRGDLRETQALVFNFNWETIQPPPFTASTIGCLAIDPYEITKKPSKKILRFAVSDQQVLVNGRGPYQSWFRRVLLDAYRNRCALCDTQDERLLVASHIIPWARDSENRINPQNGLLLCRNHDGLFEYGTVKIKLDYSVFWTKLKANEIGADLHKIITGMTNKKLQLPKQGFEPHPEFLQWKLNHPSG